MMKVRKLIVELKMSLIYDEDKLQELVAQAVEKLKAEGWIWREPEMVLPDTPTSGEIDGK